MSHAPAHGFSIIETVVALGLVAGVSAALLPALALAARLQRESAIETEAAVIAAGRIEYLTADVAAGLTGPGGALDTPREGWHALVDREGNDAPAASAVFDCRWHVAAAPAPAGLLIVSVRVVPIGAGGGAVTISVAVPRA